MPTHMLSDNAEKSISILQETTVLDRNFTVYGTYDEPLFLAKDIAEMIDYAKRSDGSYQVGQMLKTVDEEEKLPLKVLRAGQSREMWFLTETGMYEVLFQSTKPIAKEFKKQVKKLLHDLRVGKSVIVETKVIDEFAHIEARVEAAKLMREIAAEYTGQSKTYKQVMDAHATKMLTGTFAIPLPEVTEQGETAGEIGERYGLSCQKVGAIIKKYGILKSKENGFYRVNKAKGVNKEVETFYYNADAVKSIEKAIEIEGVSKK